MTSGKASSGDDGQLSGLEQMRNLVSGVEPVAPMLELLGLRVTEADLGRVVIRSNPQRALAVKFVKAILADTGPLVCEGKVVSSGSRLTMTEARLTDEQGVLYAYASCTCMRVRR